MGQQSDQYVPHDTGTTRLEMKTDLKNNQIIWENEYVEFIYWGINRWGPVKFKTDKNFRAQKQWADVAINKNINKWANDYIDAIIDAF